MVWNPTGNFCNEVCSVRGSVVKYIVLSQQKNHKDLGDCSVLLIDFLEKGESRSLDSKFKSWCLVGAFFRVDHYIHAHMRQIHEMM